MIKKKLFQKLTYKFSKLTAGINLKPKELNIGENQKCLCLSPHADDESIGMGGVLSLFANNFEVILLTDGRKGIKDKSVEEVIKIRENEFINAMKIAGINEYNFLYAEDKKLLDSFDLFKTYLNRNTPHPNHPPSFFDTQSKKAESFPQGREGATQKSTSVLEKYDYIFVPNIIDQHPDHKAVSLLLQRLLDKNIKIKPDLQICFYEVWSTLGMVNSFVDITEVIEKKKLMINCYQSQTAQKDYEYYALGLNQYRGMFKDKKYVEAFCVLSVDEFKKICELY